MFPAPAAAFPARLFETCRVDKRVDRRYPIVPTAGLQDSLVERLGRKPDDVNRQPTAPTVWIVDDDLGFVLWLGEIFTAVGCRALPALSTRQAASLMNELRTGIDLLVVNPDLRGVAGMLQTLRLANRNLKIVFIVRSPQALTAPIQAQANLERPSGSDPISRPEWIEKARILLKQLRDPSAH